MHSSYALMAEESASFGWLTASCACAEACQHNNPLPPHLPSLHSFKMPLCTHRDRNTPSCYPSLNLCSSGNHQSPRPIAAASAARLRGWSIVVGFDCSSGSLGSSNLRLLRSRRSGSIRCLSASVVRRGGRPWVEGRRTGAGSWLSFGGLEVGDVQLRLAANLNIRGVITLGVSMSSSLGNQTCLVLGKSIHLDTLLLSAGSCEGASASGPACINRSDCTWPDMTVDNCPHQRK